MLEVNTMDRILAIDTNLTVNEQQTAEWEKIGVGTLRVDTMSEAISRLVSGDRFLFVAINEDSIPDFWGPLRIMRDITTAPIFIITSTYAVAKHTKAVQHGADAYGAFAEQTAGDVLAGLELLKLQDRWAKQPGKKISVLVGGDVVLSTKRRIVLVTDKKIKLTKKEFDLLRALIANHDCFLEPVQLLRKVWGDEYTENGNNVLWQTINRLRNKLAEAAPDKDYIIVERDVGYKFLG